METALNTAKSMPMNSSRKVPELSLGTYLHGGLTERARFIDQFFLGL